MYKIKIEYITGNSFGSEELVEALDMSWNDLKIVGENLQRIIDHYKIYEEIGYNKPDEDLELPVGCFWDKEYHFLGLNLLTDVREEFTQHVFWTGYFETLISVDVGLDMKRWVN